MGQTPCRQLRSGVCRCALSRHRDVAPQPRCQMAHAPAGSEPSSSNASNRSCAALRASCARADASSTRPAHCCARKTKLRPKRFSPPSRILRCCRSPRVWAETIGGASPGGEQYLRLTPARHGTDGFFVAIFERQTMSDRILILDFGSQVTQLIARRVRESGVYCEIHPFTISEDRVRDFAPRGIILSGGPASLTEAASPRAPEIVFRLGVPVLGICYGMQTMCAQLGGRVTSERPSGIRPRLYRHPRRMPRCSTACGRRAGASRCG